MKAATGEYINLYTEIGYNDETDLKDDKLDIFILFCEADTGNINMTEMENRARRAIEKWKNRYYVPKKSINDTSLRFIPEKVKKVLQKEFEEAVLIVVNEIL